MYLSVPVVVEMAALREAHTVNVLREHLYKILTPTITQTISKTPIIFPTLSRIFSHPNRIAIVLVNRHPRNLRLLTMWVAAQNLFQSRIPVNISLLLRK